MQCQCDQMTWAKGSEIALKNAKSGAEMAFLKRTSQIVCSLLEAIVPTINSAKAIQGINV